MTVAKDMTRDEIIRALAELVAGLQVPVSLHLPLGTAREPWEKLHRVANGGFGWYNADKAEVNFRASLADEIVRRVETGQYMRKDGTWVWVKHDVGKSVDVTPDPMAWPECPECHTAWVLRRAMQFPKGYIWVWQRDCKHKKADPVVNKDAAAEVLT